VALVPTHVGRTRRVCIIKGQYFSDVRFAPESGIRRAIAVLRSNSERCDIHSISASVSRRSRQTSYWLISSAFPSDPTVTTRRHSGAGRQELREPDAIQDISKDI